jgi:putative transposase
LTFSCYKGQAFFSRERTCAFLAEAIHKARNKHPFDLWAYVFMPEHVHMLIWPIPDQSTASEIRHCVKQSVARRAIAFLREHNPQGLRFLATGQKHTQYRFWQDGGGHDRPLHAGTLLRRVAEYYHANPVRRGLVVSPEDWYWSSARDWAGMGPGPIPVNMESFPHW